MKNKNISELYDLDIFIFLPSLKIHIATAGAILPDYILSLANNNYIIYDYYNTIDSKNEYLINPNLEEIVYKKEYSKRNDFDEKLYLESFIKLASKGFYSFDKTNIQDPLDKKFHLVAYPINNDEKFNDLFFLKENQLFIESAIQTILPLITDIKNNRFNPIDLEY